MAKERLKFIQQRVVDISKDLKKVNKWDEFHKYYDDKGKEVTKKFPAANKGALNNFRTLNIVKDPSESGRMSRPGTAQQQIMRIDSDIQALVDRNKF